ncbi:3642_t:CDS:2 [Entrophospora sp. SA101]|nr:3642_t:CDS:2 [Entrophospora sp. SA101]
MRTSFFNSSVADLFNLVGFGEENSDFVFIDRERYSAGVEFEALAVEVAFELLAFVSFVSEIAFLVDSESVVLIIKLKFKHEYLLLSG